MGTIVSPVDGSSIYKGQTKGIVYRSDAVDFDCGSLSKICRIDYLLDGVSQSGLVNISQTGVAPQTQNSQAITFPATGATATVDVDARGVGGQQNDTATATYDLIDLPSAVCDPAANVAATSANLNATIAGILLAGGSARFVFGSPTPNTNAVTSYTTGSVSASITGLTANTTYNYRLEILDDNGDVIAASGQCSFTTSAAAIPVSADAALVKLCSITGVLLLRDCTTGEPVIMVTVAGADGDVIPVDSTEFPAGAGAGIFSTLGYYRSYYADVAGNLLTLQSTDVCLPSSAATANHLSSTIDRVIGVDVLTISPNARSVTVAVNAGNPTVQVGSNTAVSLVPGLSFTWGTDDRDEDLADEFVFTGIAGSDFFVTTSRI